MAAPMATGDRPRIDFNTLAASVEIPILVVGHDATKLSAAVTSKDTKNSATDQNAAINQAAYGKKAGAMVHLFKATSATDKTPKELIGTLVAEGSGKADKWHDLLTGFSITPAA